MQLNQSYHLLNRLWAYLIALNGDVFINSLHLQLEDAAAPQPANLSHYDADMDGRISTKEFELGLNDDVTFEEALQAHMQADLNGKCCSLHQLVRVELNTSMYYIIGHWSDVGEVITAVAFAQLISDQIRLQARALNNRDSNHVN